MPVIAIPALFALVTAIYHRVALARPLRLVRVHVTRYACGREVIRTQVCAPFCYRDRFGDLMMATHWTDLGDAYGSVDAAEAHLVRLEPYLRQIGLDPHRVASAYGTLVFRAEVGVTYEQHLQYGGYEPWRAGHYLPPDPALWPPRDGAQFLSPEAAS